MMSPEVQKLAAQCVIDYLGGHKERFEELVNKAMALNGEMACNNCKGTQIPCRYIRNGKKVKGYYCTDCGQAVDKDNVVVRPGRARRKISC